MANQDFLTDAPSGDLPVEPHREETAPSHRNRERRGLKVSAPRGFTMREAIRLLFKHKWVLLLPLFIVPPIGYFYAQTLTPLYIASARIQVQATELRELLPTTGVAMSSGRSVLNDQVLLLMSDSMLESLVNRMRLADMVAISSEQTLDETERISAIILRLKNNVLRVTAIPKTQSISISAQWPENADMPALIANNLANLYVENVRAQIEAAAQSFSTTYLRQSENTQQDLDAVNLQIDQFLRDNSVASVEGRMQSLGEDLSRVRNAIWGHRNELVTLDVEIEAIESQLLKGSEIIAGATTLAVNPEYVQAQTYLDGLMLRKVNELGRWLPDSPRIKNLDKQIEEAQAQLASVPTQIVVEGEMRSSPAFDQLQASLPQLRLLRLSTARKMEALEREERALNEEIIAFGQVNQQYERLKTRKQELTERLRFERDRAAQAENREVFVDQITDVKVADTARRPLAPSPTRKNMIILMSIAGGFGLGIGLAGLRELLNQTLETSDDVHKHLQMPVLGAIPDKVLR